MEYAVGPFFSFSMSLQSDHTCCLDKPEEGTCLHFSCVMSHLSSLLFIQQFNSMLSTDSTTVDATNTPTSVDSMPRLFMFLCLATGGILGAQSYPGNFCFQGFFLFIIPTSSPGTSIGSMSSPFVGFTSALLSHTRFPTAEKCSRCWFPLTSPPC